jgi:hypothetical protein
MDFKVFKEAVAKQFDKLQMHSMYRVDVVHPEGLSDKEISELPTIKDLMWDTYLSSFPEGTNELFRVRTEHDCSCCKRFIRAVGNVVGIRNGQVVSVWDVSLPSEPGYQAVADALSKLVKSYPIKNTFLHFENKAGEDKNFEDLIDEKGGNSRIQWNHFFGNIKSQFVADKASIPTKLASPREQHDMLIQALKEFDDSSVETVLELISQNSLYRGEEKKWVVKEFQAVKKTTKGMDAETLNLYVWDKVASGQIPQQVARIRGDVIGTLIGDLSEGFDLEDAVRSFEVKMAGPNYRRPKALVTQKDIERAKVKLEELGLTSALDRRYAKLTDIDINDQLFVNREARAVMTGSVFDDLAANAPVKFKTFDKVQEIAVDRFINDVLPKIQSMEILFEDRLKPRLVSLVAPVDATAGNLFKWDNRISWSYVGEVADGIKERVKNAGGNVAGDLCCRLAWSNYDDLDLHMIEPGGHEISFWQKGPSLKGGRLDVDMNAGSGKTREPVENIFYADRRTMTEGVYTLVVHQYNQRETKDVGFDVEIDFMGEVRSFHYPQALGTGHKVTVAKMKYTKEGGIEFLEGLEGSATSKEMWGLQTQQFQNVNVLTLSPNFWDGQKTLADAMATDRSGVGNKHYFFMLSGCINADTARPFYNEFLKPELDQHRKVFEMVGAKLRLDDAAEQMSGLGFSSTVKNHVIARVRGEFSRDLKITFGS